MPSRGSRHHDFTVSNSSQDCGCITAIVCGVCSAQGPGVNSKTQCHQPMLVAPLTPLPLPCPTGGLPICSVHCCLQIHYLSCLYVTHLLVYPFSFASSPQEGFAVEMQQRKGLRDALEVTSGWKASFCLVWHRLGQIVSLHLDMSEVSSLSAML